MELNAVKNGATYKPADARPGELYWKLVKAEGPVEWGGRHSIYVDVWDEDGDRIENVRVALVFPDGRVEKKFTERKLGEPFALDFPMFNAAPALGVWIDDMFVSDELHGLGLVPFEKHMVYKLIFQETRAEGTVTPPPPTPTPPGNKSKVRLYLDDVLVYEK